MPLLRNALCAVALCASVTVGRVNSAQAEPWQAGGQIAGVAVEHTRIFLEDVALQQIEQAVWELQQRVGAYVAAVEAAQKVPTSPAGSANSQSAMVPAGGRGGCCTQAQLTALARCESGTNPFAGDPSPWRTGYFGLEAGHPIGGLSLGEQIAMVEDIYARYGPRAWGCGGVL